MPTVVTHAVVPLAAALALGSHRPGPQLLAAGMIAAMLPDADVLAFAFGIPYADDFGHRGASHSLLFAALVATIGALAHRALRAGVTWSWLWLFACTASHPLLDAFTNGGLGVALFWPWSEARLFVPWRPIAVSPIGAGFFSRRGLHVLWSELHWVWLPAGVVAVSSHALRRATALFSSR